MSYYHSIQHITKAALWLLKRVYQPGVYYLKGGVMQMELVAEGGQQRELFGFSQRDSKNQRLMGMIDEVNAKYGRGTVKTGAEGVRQDWQMRRELMSPGYLNNWDELLEVK